ncbi:hypothetical protein MMC17_006372 [Xylographa soralifera]|nr:hypothetical protein [Xylographa soralifera]
MPRQRGRSAAPARVSPRPVVAPARPNVAPPQQRSSSTATQPPVATTQKPQAGQSPGLFGQMASTAAGVAVGSSIGHALGGFFGGSGQATAESQAADGLVASQGHGETYETTIYGKNCEVDARSFTKCLDENKGNDYQMSICGWYLEQLVSFQSLYEDL